MTFGTEGRSLELFFIDGKPDGMLTAEVWNWTGHILMAPRTRIGAALSRKEASFIGVYILIGEKDGQPTAYIGEGEDIRERIKSHDVKKEWWDSVVLITTSANSLNKAHVKYLEARLVEEARKVGRVTLDNGATPTRSGLSEAVQSNMEAFLSQILMVLPALRIDVFVQNARPKSNDADAKSSPEPVAEFELESRKHSLRALSVLKNGEFIVLALSQARLSWEGANTQHSVYAKLHSDLIKQGVLPAEGGHCVFTVDYAFASPSAAASVVCGRPAAGTVEWKLKGQKKNYKEWEAGRLANIADPLGGRLEPLQGK